MLALPAPLAPPAPPPLPSLRPLPSMPTLATLTTLTLASGSVSLSFAGEDGGRLASCLRQGSVELIDVAAEGVLKAFEEVESLCCEMVPGGGRECAVVLDGTGANLAAGPQMEAAEGSAVASPSAAAFEAILGSWDAEPPSALLQLLLACDCADQPPPTAALVHERVRGLRYLYTEHFASLGVGLSAARGRLLSTGTAA